MHGLMLHVAGDALGNVGVITSGLVIWFAHGEWRFYMDPLASLVITAIIAFNTIPLGE
jgi:zinc transporter 1